MNTEHSKTLREIETFRQFVKVANLPIDLGTVEKRQSPEPDILCTHRDDGLLAFELTEICDPNFAKFFSKVGKGEVSGGAYYMRTTDPSPLIIKKKLWKRYRTEYPIELLCYTDGRVATPVKMIREQLQVQVTIRCRFRRVWLMSSDEVHMVYEVNR